MRLHGGTPPASERILGAGDRGRRTPERPREEEPAVPCRLPKPLRQCVARRPLDLVVTRVDAVVAPGPSPSTSRDYVRIARYALGPSPVSPSSPFRSSFPLDASQDRHPSRLPSTRPRPVRAVSGLPLPFDACSARLAASRSRSRARVSSHGLPSSQVSLRPDLPVVKGKSARNPSASRALAIAQRTLFRGRGYTELA